MVVALENITPVRVIFFLITVSLKQVILALWLLYHTEKCVFKYAKKMHVDADR